MGTYTTDIDVRFRDIDPLRHVSHTVYVVYMQQARLEFCEAELDLPESDYDTVVVHLEVDYHDDVTQRDDVAVETSITDVGESSFTMGYEVTANGETAATGESVQVVVGAETGDSCAVPDDWRSVFEAYSG